MCAKKVNRTDGSVTIVSSSTTCPKNSTAVQWNQQGPAGPTGPQGPAGPSGSGGSGINGVPFYCSDCYLTPYADQLAGKDLTHSQISHSHFPYADLTGVILKDSYLDGNDFLGANLTNADLSDMVMPTSENSFGFSGGGNNFDRATLTGANLSGNFFSSNNFNGANLTNANLSNSQFDYVVFNGADLTGADFSSDAFGVYGSTVDFTGALHMDSAIFAAVNWYDAYCPDGFHVHGTDCTGHMTPASPPYPVRF